MPESAAYVGMFTLLAAPLSLMHRSRRYAIFLAALTVTLSPWHMDWNRSLAGEPHPGPGRARTVGWFSSLRLALPAGLGISALEETPVKPGRRTGRWFVAMAFILAFALVRHLQLAATFRVEFTRRPSFSKALLIISFVPILWRLYGGCAGALSYSRPAA
jgi:hypothetical protein